jgi:hypothetical protein
MRTHAQSPTSTATVGRGTRAKLPTRYAPPCSPPGHRWTAPPGRSWSRCWATTSPASVHTDDHAADATGAIGARAYTIGHDLVFAPGQYAPSSAKGRRLLAHELAHVAQQPAAHGVPEHLDRTLRDDPAEREANAAADAVTSGRRLVPRLVHSPTIACQDMGTPGRGPSPYLGGAPDAPYAPDREPYFGAPEPVPMPGLEPTPGPGAPAASPVRLLGVEVTPSHRGHFAQVPGTGSGTHWVGAWRSRAPGGPCRTPSPGA